MGNLQDNPANLSRFRKYLRNVLRRNGIRVNKGIKHNNRLVPGDYVISRRWRMPKRIALETT